ncbi:MAG: CBS domain-containing protein [Acidimicrobiales bacterium]
MLISQILRGKGDAVEWTTPTSTIEDVVAALATHGVGALVVSSDGVTVEGIISERDIVRDLAVRGAGILTRTARDLMTADVVTCGRDATSEELMAQMTSGRFRHVPVVDDGRLVGIVSIGDVVNARVRELETEAEHLTNYISGR